MYFENLFKNKKILFLLLILNFLGVCFAFYTYFKILLLYLPTPQFFLIPFFMVSFWLYLLAFLFLLYLFLGKKIPLFFGGFAFLYCFVYGFGSFLFYPLFMIFVKGFTWYHFYNIFAHAFVGVQSLFFLSYLRKIKLSFFVVYFLIFFLKDVLDLFFGGFLYFVKYDFSFPLKSLLVFLVLSLQILSFYLLFRQCKNFK